VVKVDTPVRAAVVDKDVLVLRRLLGLLSRPLELKVRVQGDLDSPAVADRGREGRQRAGGRRQHFFQSRSDDLLLRHFADWSTP